MYIISPVLYAMGFSFHENLKQMELNVILYLITVVEDVKMDKQGKTLELLSTIRSGLCTGREHMPKLSAFLFINLMNAF